MPQKTLTSTLSIYNPNGKANQRPLERLTLLAKKRDRSVNYLVVQAIMEYLEKEDRQ